MLSPYRRAPEPDEPPPDFYPRPPAMTGAEKFMSTFIVVGGGGIFAILAAARVSVSVLPLLLACPLLGAAFGAIAAAWKRERR